MKVKEIDQRMGITLASAIVLITVFTLAVTITPASAQENRRQIPEGVFENRNLNRPVEIEGNLIIEGNIGPEGDIVGEGDLEVGENVNGVVDISGDIEIGGNVESNADISATGNVSIGGSISPGATLSLETPGTTLNVEAGMEGGSIEVSAGDVEINIGENLESGNISLTGENSRVDIAGSTGEESVIDGVPSVNVGKNVSGEIDVTRSVSVGENLREEGRLISDNNIEVGKSVSGEARSENNVSIGENLREGGSVTLESSGKTLEIGGAMEGEATVTENASVSIGEVPVETPVDVSVEASPLDGVNISVQNEITDLDIEISNLEGDIDVDIDSPEGPVYNYQEIDTTATEEEIEEAKLNANVERSWLEEQGIDPENIQINRYHDGEWVELPTEVIDENSTHIEVEAETSGFSTFSITGVESVEEPDEGLPWMLIGGIIIVVAIIAVVGALALKR